MGGAWQDSNTVRISIEKYYGKNMNIKRWIETKIYAPETILLCDRLQENPSKISDLATRQVIITIKEWGNKLDKRKVNRAATRAYAKSRLQEALGILITGELPKTEPDAYVTAAQQSATAAAQSMMETKLQMMQDATTHRSAMDRLKIELEWEKYYKEREGAYRCNFAGIINGCTHQKRGCL